VRVGLWLTEEMVRRLLGCLFVLAMALAAAEASGKWVGTAGDYKVALELKQEGEKLTGTLAPNDGTPIDIENGKVQGGVITFELNPGGRYTFKLELKGEQLKGTVVSGDGITMDVELKRP
jgi:hypothetical protein